VLLERVQIEPKEEQTLRFTVDSEPLLVGFDYGGTLIKELIFVKTTGQLLYQLGNDKDVLGRIWALSQLTPRMNDEKTLAADREAIRKALVLFADAPLMNHFRSNAMAQNFSWDRTTRDYLQVYERALKQ